MTNSESSSGGCGPLLARFITQHLPSYITGLVLLVATSLTAMTVPALLGSITDDLTVHPLAQEKILWKVLLLLGVVVLVFGLKFFWRLLLIGNCRTIEVYLRDHLFSHLQKLPVSFYNGRKTGDLVAYAINDVQALRMVFGPGLLQSLDGMTIGIASLVCMSSLVSPVMALGASIPLVLALVLMVKMAPPIRQRFAQVQQVYADIADRVQENLSGIRVIKAYAQEEAEQESFSHLSEGRVQAQMRLTKVSGLLNPAVQFCFGLSFLVFIIMGGRLALNGQISLGDFVACNMYLLAIMTPLSNVGRIIEFWQKGLASFKRLDVLFQVHPPLGLEAPPVPGAGLDGSLEFRQVSFVHRGSSHPTLSHVSFKLEKGKTLGIIGATGSGKTTLANLVLRLHDPTSGQILVNGQDIRHIPLAQLREDIGYVPQDNFLFSTTIKANIEFFRQLYSDDEIREATRQSAIYDSIMDFPEGFDTIVGERGVTLSGGQKQRISIARALVKDPQILILDDSLSAVDTLTEKTILGHLKSFLRHRSGIIIAHRVSTVRFADEILYLKDGKIAERGTHQDLMEKNGAYAELYRSQMDSLTALQEVP